MLWIAGWSTFNASDGDVAIAVLVVSVIAVIVIVVDWIARARKIGTPKLEPVLGIVVALVVGYGAWTFVGQRVDWPSRHDTCVTEHSAR